MVDNHSVSIQTEVMQQLKEYETIVRKTGRSNRVNRTLIDNKVKETVMVHPEVLLHILQTADETTSSEVLFNTKPEFPQYDSATSAS